MNQTFQKYYIAFKFLISQLDALMQFAVGLPIIYNLYRLQLHSSKPGLNVSQHRETQFKGNPVSQGKCPISGYCTFDDVALVYYQYQNIVYY